MPSRHEVYAMEFKPTAGPAKLNEFRFPTFGNGDARIIISGSRQYQLHKSILKNSSTLFHELLSDENTAQLSKRAQKKVVITNILRAEDNESDGSKPSITLKPIKLDEEGRPVSALKIGLDLENGMAPPLVHTVRERYCNSSLTLLTDCAGLRQGAGRILPPSNQPQRLRSHPSQGHPSHHHRSA